MSPVGTLPPLRLIVGSRDITEKHRQLVYSNADPGGLEALTCAPRDPTVIRAGDPVLLTCGLETAWKGTVNDPGDKLDSGRGSGVLAALGPGMRLKNGAPALFVHSDLTQWQDIQGSLTADMTAFIAGPVVTADGGVKITFPQGTPIPFDKQGAVVLDLGAGLTGARVVITYDAVNVTASQSLFMRAYASSPTTVAAGANVSGFPTLGTGGAQSGTIAATLTTPARFLVLGLYQGNAGTLTPTADEWVRFTSILVFADPAYEAGNASIVNPATVARYAFAQAGGIAPGEIGDASALALQHLLYGTPAPYETMTDDAARLMGWHWGVWEPGSLLGDQRSRGFFKQGPAQATCAVSWAECTGGEAPRVRSDLLYDTCRCQYQTVDGLTGFATATRQNPLLPQSQSPRTLEVNMGVGNSTTAQLYAGFALALAQRASRGGGWAQLPAFVQTPTGPRPSCLLRAGRDRLRVTGLPDAGNLLETDTRRYDTFHLKRVEVTVDDRGAPRTRVEFDGGGDLMEVLNARLALPSARAAQIVGAA